MEISFKWRENEKGIRHSLFIDGREEYLNLGYTSTEKEATEEIIKLLKEKYNIVISTRHVIFKYSNKIK